MASLRLGDVAPDFEQDSSEGRIRFHAWLADSWGVLFSHPADFTPVCTTELGLTAKLRDEFAKRKVKVIALSVDPAESHARRISDINETRSQLRRDLAEVPQGLPRREAVPAPHPATQPLSASGR